MDLDLWDCLRRVKLVLLQNFIGLIYLFEVILEEKKNLSYSQINMVHAVIWSENNRNLKYRLVIKSYRPFPARKKHANRHVRVVPLVKLINQ